jgi:glycerol-3-phosphate dehydrogenase
MGSGSWGTTVAKVIADGGHEVTLWARRAEIADEINQTHRNGDYLPGIDLPQNLSGWLFAECSRHQGLFLRLTQEAVSYFHAPVIFRQ